MNRDYESFPGVHLSRAEAGGNRSPPPKAQKNRSFLLRAEWNTLAYRPR
jgi:hypothetical protein